MNLTLKIIFHHLILLLQSAVASDNVQLGFDPVATLHQNCLVIPNTLSPNLFERKEGENITIIDAQLFVNKIHELEPISRTFSLTGMIKLSWFVPCLKRLYDGDRWPKKDFTYLKLNPSDFWKPTMLHRSSHTEVNFQGRTDILLNAILTSGIFVEYIPGMFTMLCSFDFRKFPFDSQSCDMLLFMMADSVFNRFGTTKIVFFPNPIEESIDWELVNHTSSSAIGFSDNSEALFTFTFNRKSYYYVVTLLIPGFALHCLILVSYFLPPDTTDRTVYAATVELAFYFFQIEFNRALPQSSTPIYMQVYLIGMLIGCTLITIYSAILCYIANLNSKLATKSITFCGKKHQLVYVVDFFISFFFLIISISLAFIPLSMCFI